MKTLLVLDDHPGVVDFLRDILRQYRVLEAATAEQALHLFRTYSREIDLLLSDVTLPRSSGIQIALLLRSEIPDLPVILTSGYPVSDWKDRDCTDLQRLGSTKVSLLAKPIQVQDLLTTIDNLTGAGPSEIGRTA